MSFDGILLSKLKKEFDVLKTGRINKISSNLETEYIFTVRSNYANHNLLISLSSSYARIHLTDKKLEHSLQPKGFLLFLRKHIQGYFIEDILTHSSDRIIYFKLVGYNELEDKNTKYLIAEIMGRYSNLILTDENFKIIDALKHDGVGEYNRTIMPNANYIFPESNKINPLDLSYDEIIDIFKKENINNPKDLLNKFEGISYTLAVSVFSYEKYIDKFYEFINLDEDPAIIKDFKGNTDFYYHKLNYEVIKPYESISKLLDEYYYELDLKAKIKIKTNDLTTFIDREIKKYQKKIEKLNKELADTSNLESYKINGELLLSYPNLKEKSKGVEVYNYYTDKFVYITLDEKYTIIENSNRYFKKYQKTKNSIKYINEQIEISKNELEYFILLKSQLDYTTLEEALEIQDELIKNKYLFNQKTEQKKKKQAISLTQYLVDDVVISVGKNNVQNEYLTHKYAKHNDYWFHVKDYPGSHVVIHSDTLTENLIRTAANLAAYYSTESNSSSVAVDYTQIKNIKKIPGRRNCFVTYTKNLTIYIDPNKELIDSLKRK